MATPPVPPRPFDNYDDYKHSSPPPIPPLPPNFNPEQEQFSSPHFEDPLVAPRPHKLQPDLPANISRDLEEQLTSPSYHQDRNMFPSFQMNNVPPPQGADWSPWAIPSPNPANQPYGSPNPRHQHSDSLASTYSNMSISSPPPRSSSYYPPAQPPATMGPPSLTAPLPTIPSLLASLNAVQSSNSDPARTIAWCRDVLSLVDRAQQLDSSSQDAQDVVGPARIADPQLQRMVDVALPRILQIASQAQSLQGQQIPAPVAEALYLRATCTASGAYPAHVAHSPRQAFRDFEQAARGGYHAAWFKLGRDYETFGDVAHARDCFQRGIKHGVESCYYRMGMANLMGQLGLTPSPEDALPLLHRAATLATVAVPQPAYVYGLLLLNEFAHVAIPSALFAPYIPPGSTLETEARKHLERAAYLNFAAAQYKLGHAYEFAVPPFPFDALLSVQYYSLASQQGEIEADMALSKWFLCGAEGAFDKDEALAATFAEKAARKGLPSAEFAMGYYAEVGVSGPKDIDAARKWYKRAAAHGNTDATERLAVLSQPQPQSLSRQEHEHITDAKLVRRRTQAKQRSEAVGGVAPVATVPSGQIVEGIRRNSLIGAAPGGFRVPQTQSSPPSVGAPLPSVEERIYPASPSPSGPRPGYQGQPPTSHPGSPVPVPGSSPSQRPFANSPRYNLVDPGSNSAPAPASPRPGASPAGGARSSSRPSSSDVAPQVPSDPAPRRPAAGKGPQTFADMGIVTAKVEEKECVIM